jgi:hypothetical protein
MTSPERVHLRAMTSPEWIHLRVETSPERIHLQVENHWKPQFGIGVLGGPLEAAIRTYGQCRMFSTPDRRSAVECRRRVPADQAGLRVLQIIAA